MTVQELIDMLQESVEENAEVSGYRVYISVSGEHMFSEKQGAFAGTIHVDTAHKFVDIEEMED